MIAFTRTITPGITLQYTGVETMIAHNETEAQLVARCSPKEPTVGLCRWQEGCFRPQFVDDKADTKLTNLDYLGNEGVFNALREELITHSSFSAMQTLVNNLIDCLVSTKEIPNDPV